MSYKYTITIFLTILTLTTLFATDVSGNVQGVWQARNNPYNVIGNLTVPVGQSLTIQAGVNVIFTGSYSLTVYGHIDVIGTVADSVRFSGEAWQYIWLEDTPQTNIFTHCVITGANIGIDSVYSSFELSHSRIGNSSNKAISMLGDNGLPTYITRSKIHNTVTAGINLTSVYNVYITDNEITRCSSSNQYQGAIHYSMQGALTPPATEYLPLIKNNHIHHNYKQGIITWDITGGNRMRVNIENNVIENNLTGVYFRSTTGLLHNNLICNNFIAGDANSGAGIMLAGIGTATIYDNIITGNFTGFYITENAIPSLANGNNIIHNNIDGSGSRWSIYLYGATNNVNASGNYFHSNDPDVIATTIFDNNDNPALGEVTFLPLVQGGLMTGNIDLQDTSEEVVYYQFTFSDTQQENDPLVLTTHRNNPEYQLIVPAGVYNVTVQVNDTDFTGEFLDVVIQENDITAGVDFILSDASSVASDTVPRPSLSVNSYPNPLSAGQSVKFDIKSDTRAEMTLELFNIKGQKVATVFAGVGDSREISYILDKKTPSGVYFYRLKAGDSAIVKKMVVIK